MYINAIEAKRMVTEAKELNAQFRELIRGNAQLYAFQSRTSEYSMSPERFVIRRETEVQVLTRLIGQVVRLNRESGCSFLAGFIRDFNKTQTKWDLIDEVYEMAMGWIATEEEMYDILFPAQIA